MKAYRVDFNYIDRAYLHIVAETEEAAKTGALQMLKHIKNPEVTKITEVSQDEPEQLELPLEAPKTIN